MTEKRTSQNGSLNIRSYGYLIAMIILGISIGLLLYPTLRFPAIWQWGTLGLSLVVMLLTAPALRGKK